MRLGGQDIQIKPQSQAYKLYQSECVRKRFRHRYEVNEKYIEALEKGGLIFS